MSFVECQVVLSVSYPSRCQYIIAVKNARSVCITFYLFQYIDTESILQRKQTSVLLRVLYYSSRHSDRGNAWVFIPSYIKSLEQHDR